MIKFIKETEGIYRLKVPFEAIYTSVFLLTSPSDAMLVDCATTDEDVKNCIVPALEEMGYRLSDIDKLVLTHSHGDHAGGLGAVMELSPNIEVIRDAREVFDGIFTIPMPGHSEDCIGVLDTRSRTLISGDGLQGAGVDKYRGSVKLPDAYFETIERIRKDERIENILFSHAYEPWNKSNIIGRDAVNACLSECIKYVNVEKK